MIIIMLLTFDRLDYAKKTLASAAKNLQVSESIWMHLADDGSSQEYRDELLDLAHSLWGDNVSITNSDRGGYGASYNAATQIVHSISDLVLPLEDDWELIRPLNLDPIAKVLRDEIFGCVRMGYIGYTQELRSKFVWAEDYHWLALDPDSAEPHVFSGGPRLETVAWERTVGLWPEGEAAGVTEFEVAQRRVAREGVAWPIELIGVRGDAFVHIGTHVVKNAPLKMLV